MQSLQLSMEQTATSSSSYVANTSANSLTDDGHQLTASSPSSTSTSTTVMPVRAAKTRAARKTRPRVSPYPATSPPAVSVAVESSSLQQHTELIQASDHDQQQQQQYTSPMMDTYRYDHGIHQAQQSGQYAMYSGYSNGNDVVHQQQLYNYVGPNGHEAGSSNHSTADLYNPYYTETDANAATSSIYPSALVLPRHYTAMPEGI